MSVELRLAFDCLSCGSKRKTSGFDISQASEKPMGQFARIMTCHHCGAETKLDIAFSLSLVNKEPS